MFSLLFKVKSWLDILASYELSVYKYFKQFKSFLVTRAYLNKLLLFNKIYIIIFCFILSIRILKFFIVRDKV